ncbi:MAG: hypothetical protein LUH03_04935 [Oscillospiraceae bacterium]|nr:hypothetical protein [Oscillospiraceae bacterium]
MIEITKWDRYYSDVKANYDEAKQYYPYMEIKKPPTMEPCLVRISVIAVDKEIINATFAKEEDFTGDFSKKIIIEVPLWYKVKGCIVYGAGWVDVGRLPKKDIHFHSLDKTKDGYQMCIGVPESFSRMENVILESIRTADAMLVAYEKVMRGIDKSLNLIAYAHGDAGREQFNNTFRAGNYVKKR